MTTPVSPRLYADKIKQYYQWVDDSTLLQDKSYTFSRNPEMVEKIVGMFDENGVYVRQGWEATPCKGTEGLRRFFGSQRFLVGQHDIRRMEDIDGLAITLSEDFLQKHPDMDTSKLHTIKVTGTFTGAKMNVDKTGFAEHAEGTPLPFKDYWVFSNDKVLYRYSEIQRENKLARY